MTGIGNLTIDLIAQTASFNTNITKAAWQLNSNAAKMNRSLQNIEAGFGRLKSVVVGFAAVAGGSALVAAGGRALDYAASLGEVSQQIGVTVEDLQVYRFAATQVNLTQEEMEKGLAKLTATIGKAGLGSKTEGDAFRALGINVRNASGHFKTASDIMPELANRMAAIPDPAKRAAVEVALFGRAGQKLDPLLTQGSQGIRGYRDELSKTGIISKELSDQADKAADKMSKLNMQMQISFAKVVSENAGAIHALASSFSQLAIDVAKFWSTNPQGAMAIVGSLAGASLGRVGGLPGMALGAGLGALGGYQLGDYQKGLIDEANTDLKFRQGELDKAVAKLKTLREGTFADPNSIGPVDGPARRRRGSDAEIRAAAAEVKRQAALAQTAVATANQLKLKTAPRPEFEVGNFLDTSGGGKAASDRAAEQAAKLLEQFRLQGAELEGQLNVLQLRNAGFTDEANALEDQVALERELAQIREQYKGLDPDFVRGREEQVRRLVTLQQETERFQDKLEQIDGLKIELDIDFAKEMGREIEEAVKKLPDLRSSMQRFWDEMDAMAPHAFDTVTRGIEDVLLGFGSMQDAIRSVVAELASMAMRAFIFKPIGMALGIPGFASGTDFAPGGLAIVGERGPELVNLPRGSKVTPNHQMNTWGFQRAAASLPDRRGARQGPLVGQMVFPNVRTAREARETMQQSNASLRRMLADNAKAGY